jgi:hypothetical protein
LPTETGGGHNRCNRPSPTTGGSTRWPQATDANTTDLVEMRLKVLMAGLAKQIARLTPKTAAREMLQNDQNAASQAGTQAVAGRKPSAVNPPLSGSLGSSRSR